MGCLVPSLSGKNTAEDDRAVVVEYAVNALICRGCWAMLILAVVVVVLKLEAAVMFNELKSNVG